VLTESNWITVPFSLGPWGHRAWRDDVVW